MHEPNESHHSVAGGLGLPASDHDESVARRVALVIGGGGAAGNAWAIGIIAGLAEAGVDLTAAADLVIGTSSGATAAAHVLSGRPPAELLSTLLSEVSSGPAARGGGRPSGGPPLPMATVFQRMRTIGAAATSAAELRRAMGAFGLESDAVLAGQSDQRRALVASRLPSQEWPDRAMIVVAVDAETGRAALFDRESGVALADAVTASTALPGMAPTHSINGRRYINGGVRSGDNADLAEGYAAVAVLSPFGGRSGAAVPDGQFEGLRRSPEWGNDLPSQVEMLRRGGSQVVVITPDSDSHSAMGTDQTDPATRRPSALAGAEQGRREAGRVTAVLSAAT